MPTPRSIESTLAELSRRCRGAVSIANDHLERYSRDFGGIVRRTPVIVFRPDSVDEILVALKTAREHGLFVTTRGSGHSQSGQCVGEGLVLDTHGLHRILSVSEVEETVEVEAGATWRAVVDETFAHGFLPLGLTHVLDTTVAGTLSVGGVGAEAWRVGPQVDNVVFLDVATFDGAITRASAAENRELFDCVRAGLGQCGVIVRAGYPLRKCRTQVRSRYFVYRASERFIRDAELACSRGTATFISGVFARDARNTRSWVVLLVLGFEYDAKAEPTDEAWTKGLSFDEELPAQDAPLWSASGIPGHLFFRLYAPAPGSLEADRNTLRPWVDHVFPRQAIGTMLGELTSGQWRVLSLGTGAVIIVRRGADPAPLFSVPTDEVGWGIGIFPSVPPNREKESVELAGAYSRRGCAVGGKRYLSGLVEFEDVAAWARHYGSHWEQFRRAKQRFDPNRLLNPGFIRWD